MARHPRNQQAPVSILVLRTNAARCGSKPMKSPPVRPKRAAALTRSNLQLVAALQIENFTGLVGGCDFKAEPFDDLAGELNLLGVRSRPPAGRPPQRALEPDADIAAHGGRHSRARQRFPR